MWVPLDRPQHASLSLLLQILQLLRHRHLSLPQEFSIFDGIESGHHCDPHSASLVQDDLDDLFERHAVINDVSFFDFRDLIYMFEGEHAADLSFHGKHGSPLNSRRLLQEVGDRRVDRLQLIRAIRIHGDLARDGDARLHVLRPLIEVLAELGDVQSPLPQLWPQRRSGCR